MLISKIFLKPYQGDAKVGESFDLSYQLEKKLFSNGFFQQKGDGFSICFHTDEIDQWQLICRDCAYMEDDEIFFYDRVFRISFHIQ